MHLARALTAGAAVLLALLTPAPAHADDYAHVSATNVAVASGGCGESLITTQWPDAYLYFHPTGTVDVRDPQNVSVDYALVEPNENVRVQLCDGQNLRGTYTVIFGYNDSANYTVTTTFTFGRRQASGSTLVHQAPTTHVSGPCASQAEVNGLRRGWTKSHVQRYVSAGRGWVVQRAAGRVRVAYRGCDGRTLAVWYSRSSPPRLLSKVLVWAE